MGTGARLDSDGSLDGRRAPRVGQCLAELTSGPGEPVTAWRGGYRWVECFEPVRLDRFSASLFALTNGGDSGPLQIMDCARSLAVYFVPAEPASVMED